MSWTSAVKEFAKENGGKFVIPKRDSEEYQKVRAIQERLRKEAEAPMPTVVEKKKRVKKEKTVQPATPSDMVVHPAPAIVKDAPVKGEKIAQPASESLVQVQPAPAEKKPRVKRSEKKVVADKAVEEEMKKPRKPRVKKEVVSAEVVL